MRTSKPLHFLMDHQLGNIGEELTQQGHTVEYLDLEKVDLILCEKAHYFTPAMMDYLPAAIKRARSKKVYEPKKVPNKTKVKAAAKETTGDH